MFILFIFLLKDQVMSHNNLDSDQRTYQEYSNKTMSKYTDFKMFCVYALPLYINFIFDPFEILQVQGSDFNSNLQLDINIYNFLLYKTRILSH